MSEKMYGVVLWADHSDHKAVIWCEDHGDLAFYRNEEHTAHGGVSLDAGDLIQFDLTQEENLRRVNNPKRLVQQQYAGLAQNLRNVERHRVPAPQRPAASRSLGNVIPFPGTAPAGQTFRPETLHAS
ncbi:MAG: hypothetical protein ACX93U_02915 [Salipiger thiooxidans]|jgi:hypothetical protein|uniref:hypothetical protein n=1 Tax=Salipiger thiooxidans TaxID=282683 RepID=UPI001A8F3AC0|nr:hypothetical protein [Salipiger thiooxidans]MBN8186160.1 hypothetical protein [Salipiger thiooxidans]MBR9836421.1 hypothetical protein [Paracoccaceae bacterium]MCA0848238.1 hypothetical protein [Salipiger thiooxidans]